MYRTIAASFAISALLIGLPTHGWTQEIGDRTTGADWAKAVCAECHAAESGQTRSPNNKAPTFQDVAASPGMTAMALRIWLQTPDPTMPNLMITDAEKDNVIAYIIGMKPGRRHVPIDQSERLPR
jgi:mono/diheme cytochrome c family protein